MLELFPWKSYYNRNDTSTTGMITKYEIDGNQCTLYLKKKEKLIVYYYFKTEKEKEYFQNHLELGALLKVDGNFEIPNQNTIPNGFNYQKYLKIHGIHYLFKASNISIERNNTSVLYAIKNMMIKRIDHIDYTGYFRTFLLGDKTFVDEGTLKEYQRNGISHLFSISGMHVSLIVSIIFFFLKKISYNKIYQYSFVIPILLFYLFLTDFSASITRTVIMYILFAINQCFHLKIKRIDIMLLTLMVAIMFRPLIIFDVGFQFSYMISFSLILFYKKINEAKGIIQKNLTVSFICFMISFPICVYSFYQVNVLSIFLNLIMIPFVSVIIFPMTLITLIVPAFYSIYDWMIGILEFINHFVANITIFELTFSKPSLWIIFLYYFVIFLSLWKKRWFFVFIVILLIHKTYPYWNSHFLFTVLDVGQGDAILLRFPFGQGNVLIDTGGKVLIQGEDWETRTSTSSIAVDRIIPYLKSLGITRLDYLILTHGDYDHMGEAIHLVENFSVKSVIFNQGEYADLENNLIDVLNQEKIKYYQGLNKLNIGSYQLQFLNSGLYNNENDNSNVIYLNYQGYKFLLMGDASTEREQDILDKYHLTNIDFLKVGHHGSNTSSSEAFINQIQPKYSLISVGKNNRYGHPKESVLDTLSNSKIYRTDIDGSIEIKMDRNGYQISTCSP